MAKTFTNPFTQNVKNFGVIIVRATTAIAVSATGVVTNNVTLYTMGSEGGVVKSIMVGSNDTAAIQMSFWYQPAGSGAILLLGKVAVPVTAGFHAASTTPMVDVLGSAQLAGMCLDQSNRPVLPLSAGSVLSVAVDVLVTADKSAWVSGVAEEYV